MKLNSDLETKLANYCDRMHIEASNYEKENFCKDFVPLKNDPGAKHYISVKIKELCAKFYNTEISTDLLNLLYGDIKLKFGTLSCQDIYLALERINDGRTDLKKYFNASDILLVMKKLQSDKQAVRSHYFQLLKEMNQDKDESEKIQVHLQNCLHKFQNKEVLNVYEKCTLGHHFIDKIPNAKEVIDLAEKELPLKKKILDKQQDARLQQSLNLKSNQSMMSQHMVYRDLEEFPDEPMVWNLRLLSGVYLFNSLPGAN